jgi:hypothetical protein
MQTVAERWIERGIEQGIEKGLKHGQIRSLQETILKLVEIRFGLVTEEMITAVNNLNDLDQLRQLRDLAITADSITPIESVLADNID